MFFVMNKSALFNSFVTQLPKHKPHKMSMYAAPPLCATPDGIQFNTIRCDVVDTHRSVSQKDRFKHRFIRSSERLSLEVAHDVGTDGRDMTTVLGNLLDLLPVENIACGKDPRYASDLERRVYLDVTIRGQNLVAKGPDEFSVWLSTSRRNLRVE